MNEIFISVSENPIGFAALLVFVISTAMIINRKDFFPVAECGMVLSSLVFFIFPFSFWGGNWLVRFIIVYFEALFFTGVFASVLCGCIALKEKFIKKTED